MGTSAESQALARAARRAARGIAFAALALGAGMFLSWLAARAGGFPALAGVGWSFSLYAATLFLGGAALLRHPRGGTVEAVVLTGAVVAALLNVAGELTDWRDLLRQTWAVTADTAPFIALGYLFAVVGIVLLGIEGRWRWRWSEWPAALALLFGLSGLLQQIVDPRMADGAHRLPMLAGLVLLAAAVLLVETRQGYFSLIARAGVGGIVARRFLPFALGLPLTVAVFRWYGEYLGLYGSWFGIVASAALVVVVVVFTLFSTGWQLQRFEDRRRLANARWRLEQEQFRSAFESSAIGMALVAPGGGILRSNAALRQMLGFSDSELRARKIHDITHPDDLEPDLAYMRQVLDGTLPAFQMEKRYIHRDGHVVWAQLTATLLRDEAGRPRHFVSQVQDISQRRETQARLAAAYDDLSRTTGLLEATIDSTTDLISALDHNFTYLAINRACADEIEAVYGFRPTVGTSLVAPLADRPAEQAAVAALWGRALAGERFTFEGAFGDPAHARRTYELTLAPMRDARGSIVGASLVGRDVSTRKRDEERLRRSEAQFRTLLDSAPDAALAVDARGFIRLVNGQAEALFGQSRDALLGQPIGPMIPDAGLVALLARLRAEPGVLRLGHDAPFHVQPIRGEAIPVEVSLTGIDLQGEWLALATVRNLSERAQMLAALRESEERLGIALRAANMGIWNLVPGENILTWDAFMGPLFGLPLGQAPLGAEAFWDLIHEDDKARVQETVVTALLCRAEYYDEYRVVWPDGEVRWVATRGRVHRDANDVPVRMAGACWDITDRKRDETRLRELAEDLGQINADLEQFAYAASHDLQEPLRAVAGCVQILERRYGDTLGEDGREVIGHAVDGARRMQTLIEDLLAYSRVGTRQKRFDAFPLGAALDEALMNLHVAIEETKAEVAHEELPDVVADRGQLRQLFQNLVGNAIKFRGPDAPRVTVDCAREPGAWRIRVRDNGIGIAPEYAERVFQVFQRLHTRREYSGTGIGLAICKRIVERHGGRIWVEAAAGGGTAFYFTIPDRSPSP